MTFAEKMDQYLERYCSLYKFSGMFRVTHKDQILYERNVGYADIEHRVSFHKDSVFTLYSMSKPFCVIGLMVLADKGLVNIDERPGKYLPEVQDIDPRITIRHLMYHMSGLRDISQEKETYSYYKVQHCANNREIVKRLVACPMNFEPGKDTLYSNINFFILALIIENVTGLRYADYMQQEVFAPLGMKHAQVDSLGKLVMNRVRGYDIQGDEIIGVERLNPDTFIGAGDVIATIDDVYCLNHAIKFKKLLKPKTWEQILTPSPISGFGLGCRVANWRGKTRIQHNGGSSGFRTLHVQLLEDDLDVILLSNFGFGESRGSLLNAVFAAFYGNQEANDEMGEMDKGYIREGYRILPEGFLPQRKPAVCLSSEWESKLLGSYMFPGEDRPTTLTKEGDRYCITAEGWQKLYCYPVSETVFASCYLDEAYKISQNKNGTVLLDGRPKIG